MDILDVLFIYRGILLLDLLTTHQFIHRTVESREHLQALLCNQHLVITHSSPWNQPSPCCHLTNYNTWVCKHPWVKLKPWGAESNDPMNHSRLTGEIESVVGQEWCVREQGVGAAASDRGDILGWWLHDWSLAVTAADGWNPSSKHVFSSPCESLTDRRQHLPCTCTYSEHWDLYS